MALFPLALPISGNSKAAGTTTTTTTTTPASNEALTTNANVNGEGAAGSSTDDLFGEDDFDAELFGEEDPVAADDDDDLERAEFLRATTLRFQERAAGRSASQSTSPVRHAAFPNLDGPDLAVAANGMTPAVAAAESAPATPPLPAAPLDPRLDWLLQGPERAVPGNEALRNNAPANGAPAKRPRGRPPGKAPPRPVVYYRCRYGCAGHRNSRDLRKHMMRVHCLFSGAHKRLIKCGICGRTVDPDIKELLCNKLNCNKELTKAERELINVQAPRDAQEEADTYAYLHSGPEIQDPSDPTKMVPSGPRRMVIVEDGDDEDAFRAACMNAMKHWPGQAPVDPAQFNHGLMTPGETPSPSNSQAVIDLTSDDEQVPATPTATYVGKGKGRAMDFPVANLAGNNTQLPSLPKKRAGDFEPEGEPMAKRTMRNVSYNETEAFAVAYPAPEETAAFAFAEPAPEDTDVAALLDNLLADHEADFPEGDFGDVHGFDLPQQHQGAAFDFGNFAFADATESDALGFNPDALPSAGIDGDMLLDFDFSL